MQRYPFSAIVFAILVMAWSPGCGKGSTQTAPREQPAATSTQIEKQDDPETSGYEPTTEPATPTTPPTATPLSPTLPPTSTPPPERPTLPPAPTAAAPVPPVVEEQPPTRADPLIALTIADLTARLGVPADNIEVVSTEEVNWSDAGLGCPLPGFMYAQVITPGWLIVLTAEGETFEYHTDQARSVVLCEDGSRPEMPSTGTGTTLDDGLSNQPVGDNVVI